MTSPRPAADVPKLFVARRQDLDVSRSWYVPIELRQGFVAVPYGEEEWERWAGLMSGLPDEAQDQFLANYSIDLMLQCAILGIRCVDRYRPAVAINVDSGRQSSVVFSCEGYQIRLADGFDGRRADWPINVGLREIGAQTGTSVDECEALGIYEAWERERWPLSFS